MIEIVVSGKTIEEAHEYSRLLGSLKGSIENGEGNAAGFVGKKSVADYLGVSLKIESKNYDIVYGGQRASIKTKRTTVVPHSTYSCSVTAHTLYSQICDVFIFVRVSYDLKRAWILGCYPKTEYENDAKLIRRGHQEGDNGYLAKETCYNLKISELKPIGFMLGMPDPKHAK